MAHLNTQLLIDYWRRRSGERRTPARSEIDPADFAALAPHVFVVQRDDDGDIRFRIAGEAVIELHGRALQGTSLASLWTAPHRPPLSRALAAALVCAEALVVAAEAPRRPRGDHRALRLEILFAPLSGPDGRVDRFLGHYQPLTRAGAGAVGELALLGLDGRAAGAAEPRLRLAVVNGRRVA
ncbi:MAG TPA: PAS domain-containing protein [Caulobacteraceae bacterium]|nr:PAS domain-containing protein [Caulobacteraceae bacterium]